MIHFLRLRNWYRYVAESWKQIFRNLTEDVSKNYMALKRFSILMSRGWLYLLHAYITIIHTCIQTNIEDDADQKNLFGLVFVEKAICTVDRAYKYTYAYIEVPSINYTHRAMGGKSEARLGQILRQKIVSPKTGNLPLTCP